MSKVRPMSRGQLVLATAGIAALLYLLLSLVLSAINQHPLEPEYLSEAASEVGLIVDRLIDWVLERGGVNV